MLGTLQKEQLKQLEAIFMRFDMDSDDSLTHLELVALLWSLGIKAICEQIHDLFHNMGTSGNGYVEFDEFVTLILLDIKKDTLINYEQLLDVFRLFDCDGSGYITNVECVRSMAKMDHPLSYTELTEMMKEADANGDGVMSFNEFANVMAKFDTDFLSLKVIVQYVVCNTRVNYPSRFERER